MPTYLYHCNSCGKTVERDTRAQQTTSYCEQTGATVSMRRVYTVPNLSAAARGFAMPIHHGRDGA